MKFAEAIAQVREGKKVQQVGWTVDFITKYNGIIVYVGEDNQPSPLSDSEFKTFEEDHADWREIK